MIKKKDIKDMKKTTQHKIANESDKVQQRLNPSE